MKEKEYQRDIQLHLQRHGWLDYHPRVSFYDRPGFPDIVAIRPPRVIFAEIKTDKGRLSPAQEEYKRQLEACPGVEYYIWRPRDWEMVKRIIEI